MFGSVILDVAIGLMLVFALLSLIASAAREGMEVWLKTRSKFLERGISQLLVEPALVSALYTHPLVAALYHGSYERAKKSRSLPSYIPSPNFALALLDLTVRGRDVTAQTDAGASATVLSVASLRENVARLQNPIVQRVVLCAVDQSGGDLSQALAIIEKWFDSSMERISGCYKRSTTRLLLAIGFFVAILANVDTIRFARRMYHDPVERQAAVVMAGAIVKNQAATPMVSVQESGVLPIGWPDAEWPAHWFTRIVGWLMSAFAVSLGAPFWFDLLNRIVMIRSTLKPYLKSPERASIGGQEHKTAVALPAPATAPAATVPASTIFEPHAWASGHSQGGIL